MARTKQLNAKIENHPQYKVPRRLYDMDSESSNEDPKLIAESMLRKIAPHLKIKPDLSQSKFDKIKKSIIGSHILYQQQHNGRPISGVWIRVDIDKTGKVYNIHNDLVPDTIIEKSKKTEDKSRATIAKAKELSLEKAKVRALIAVGAASDSTNEVMDSEPVYSPIMVFPP